MTHEEARAVPYYCPYCGDEDLRPHEQSAAWQCAGCRRVFTVGLVGLLTPNREAAW